VLVQGLLGGLRVTGRLTLSASRADMEPSITLAAVHGIFAQLFFCTLVAWSAFNSRAWRQQTPLVAPAVRTDWVLHTVLVAVLVLQLAAGAILRHTAGMLHFHITIAALTLVLAVAAGARAWGRYPQSAVIVRLAKALLLLAALQVLLGGCALFALGFLLQRSPSMPLQVVLTCGHQTLGVLLLATAVLLLVWSRRLLVPRI
jgi:heme A synthase